MSFSIKHSTVCSLLKHCFFHTHSLPTNLSAKTITLSHKVFKTSIHQTLHHLLEKCSSMRELKLLHSQIILHGLSDEILTLGKLISFCAVALSGDLQYAHHVFDHVPQPNKFMYNSLIRGHSNSDNPIEAISLYFKMVSSGFSPNEFTLPFVLKACACLVAYWEAAVVHGQAIKLGIGSQICVQNALINVYAVCGLIQCALHMFDEMPERTLVSWNLMIGGYCRLGFCREAFSLFHKMRELELKPDEFTLVHLLSVCSKSCSLKLGRCLHEYIEITGIEIDQIVRNALLDVYAKCGNLHCAETIFNRMLDKNIVSRTIMVTAYSKHGLLGFAREIFDEMPQKNVVSWNSIISCYVDEGRCNEALLLFNKMCDSFVVPDETTLATVLSACSQVGHLVIGEKAHAYILNNNMLVSSTLSNSLIYMYAKCGALGTATDLFFDSPDRNNLVSWNVIISALALHGCGMEAIKLFNMMLTDGIWPDEITFTGLLSACTHNGILDMGLYHFERMTSIYSILPEIEHYACMVDLLGRRGLLEEAIRLIGTMPMKPDLVVWGALLSACRTYGRLEIGKMILKQLLELNQPLNSGIYVLLSNIFCEARRWEDVKKIRKLMNEHGISKCRGISFIEIDGCLYEFTVDDKRRESSRAYALLDQLTDHLKSADNYFVVP